MHCAQTVARATLDNLSSGVKLFSNSKQWLRVRDTLNNLFADARSITCGEPTPNNLSIVVKSFAVYKQVVRATLNNLSIGV